MEFAVIINEQSGSIKSIEIEDYCTFLKSEFAKAGRQLKIEVTAPDDLVETLTNYAKSENYDGIIAGGGDGTASLCASLCFEHNKIYGLLPSGTMNLYARTLGIPLDLYEAATMLSKANVFDCDIATANGRPFVHQYSVGMQPRIIEVRDQLEHFNATTKMISGIKAVASVISEEPDTYQVIADPENNTNILEVSLLTVTNNPYGENQLPYADRTDRGQLGFYWAEPMARLDASKLVADILMGNWSENQHLQHSLQQTLTLQFQNIREGSQVSIDGELMPLEETVEFIMHKGAMQALVPSKT